MIAAATVEVGVFTSEGGGGRRPAPITYVHFPFSNCLSLDLASKLNKGDADLEEFMFSLGKILLLIIFDSMMRPRPTDDKMTNYTVHTSCKTSIL